MKLENQIDSMRNDRSASSSNNKDPLNVIIKEQITEIEKLRTMLKEKSEEVLTLQRKVRF